MEFSTVPVDLAWLRRLDDEADREYQEAKRARDQRGEAALNEELATQKADDRESDKLEGRYQKQQKQLAEREKAAREARERQLLEAELQLGYKLVTEDQAPARTAHCTTDAA